MCWCGTCDVAWNGQGWLAVSRFLGDTAAVNDNRVFASQLTTHLTRLKADLGTAINGSLIKDKSGRPYFLPPYAAADFQPYGSMISKTRGCESKRSLFTASLPPHVCLSGACLQIMSLVFRLQP